MKCEINYCGKVNTSEINEKYLKILSSDLDGGINFENSDR